MIGDEIKYTGKISNLTYNKKSFPTILHIINYVRKEAKAEERMRITELIFKHNFCREDYLFLISLERELMKEEKHTGEEK